MTDMREVDPLPRNLERKSSLSRFFSLTVNLDRAKLPQWFLLSSYSLSSTPLPTPLISSFPILFSSDTPQWILLTVKRGG